MARAPRWPLLANRSQGKRAVGGKIHLDEAKLRFKPNAIDAATGGEALTLPLADIASVSTEPGRITLGNLFSGGMRTRLAIDLADGRRELFVVSKPDVVAAALADILAAHATDARLDP